MLNFCKRTVRRLQEGLPRDDPCVVDQDGDRAHLGLDLLRQRVHCLAVGQVAGVAVGLASQGLDLPLKKQ